MAFGACVDTYQAPRSVKNKALHVFQVNFSDIPSTRAQFVRTCFNRKVKFGQTQWSFGKEYPLQSGQDDVVHSVQDACEQVVQSFRNLVHYSKQLQPSASRVALLLDDLNDKNYPQKYTG
jgi:hypothetical protein